MKRDSKDKADFVFFLPTRKGSERVKNKNTRKFSNFEDGLLALKIKQLLEVPKIQILLSTNDPESIRIAKKFDNERINIEIRPEELCQSDTDLQDLIEYIPEVAKAEHIIWTHVTSPFVDSILYQKAMDLYLKNLKNGFDSLMSVNRINEFLWDDESKSFANFDRTQIKWPRTQDIKSLYAINSGIFINSRKKYIELKDRIGKNPFLMEFNSLQSLDIDWEEDFKTAEKIYETITDL